MWTTCCAYSSTKLANLIECAKVFIDELLGEVLSEEGGKGGGGNVGVGEDLYEIFAHCYCKSANQARRAPSGQHRQKVGADGSFEE